MNLEEIETVADDLAFQLIDPDLGRQQHEHAALRLEGLAHAAQIKATVAYRKEREADRQQIPIMYEGALWSGVRAQAHPVSFNAEPTKPVADRLHELVSVWKGCSREQDQKAELVTDSAEQMGYHNGQAVGWAKAASMLEEILLEGGI